MYFNPQPKQIPPKLNGKAYKNLMAEMHARDDHCCGICRRPPPDGNAFTPHHINPVGTGGGDELDNAISACGECHYLIDQNIINTPKGRHKFANKRETMDFLRNRIDELKNGKELTWPV